MFCQTCNFLFILAAQMTVANAVGWHKKINATTDSKVPVILRRIWYIHYMRHWCSKRNVSLQLFSMFLIAKEMQTLKILTSQYKAPRPWSTQKKHFTLDAVRMRAWCVCMCHVRVRVCKAKYIYINTQTHFFPIFLLHAYFIGRTIKGIWHSDLCVLNFLSNINSWSKVK